MRAFFFFAAVAALSVSVEAAKTHQHGAHVHGAGEVAIAFDKEKGKIDLEAPAEGIVGFEHVAKSEKDKKRQEDALKKLEDGIGSMIAFEPALGCKFTKEEARIVQDGKHAELKATFSVDCAKPVLGSTLTLDFRKTFPGLKDVKVIILVDGVQKDADIEKSGVKVELK